MDLDKHRAMFNTAHRAPTWQVDDSERAQGDIPTSVSRLCTSNNASGQALCYSIRRGPPQT